MWRPFTNGLQLTQPTRGALRVVLNYAIFASLWILFSDTIVGLLVRDPRVMTTVNLLKGGLFVLLTAVLLLVLVTRFGSRLAEQKAKQADVERDLRESESLLTAAFQLIPVAAAITRIQDGAFMAVNEAFLRLFGYARAALEGRSLEDVGLWIDPDVWAQIVEQLKGGLPVLDREVQCRKQDGSPLTVAYSGQVVVMQGLPCLLSTALDITERRHAARERKRAAIEDQHTQKLESLGRLASGVAHDMNNVLAAIQSVAEVLAMAPERDPETRRGLEIIGKATTRGRDLVKSLTHFARKDLHEAEQVDLNLIVREEAELLGRTLLQKVKVVLDLEPRLSLILGERSTLANALMNLCVNAADAMPEGGVLTLRTRQLGQDWVVWEVADNGEGMAADVAKRALEPFFTTKPQGKGTGLGLAMVHGVVKAHGGTLQIESVPGAGTTVRMRFPAQAERAEQPVAATTPEPASVGSLRILLVDDDELIRASMPSMLSLAGHSTVTADSGSAALALLAQGLEVDLAILDLNMPEMGGLETLNRLRVLRPHLPVLIASGYVDAPHLEALGRHLMLQTLAKPFSVTELRARLQSLFPEGTP